MTPGGPAGPGAAPFPGRRPRCPVQRRRRAPPSAAARRRPAGRSPRPADAPPSGAPRPAGRRAAAAAGTASRAERRSLLSKKHRLAAALVVVVGVLGVGFANGFGGAGSAEPTVQAFLLDWQQGNYAQAAALTNGGTGQVSAQLAAAYTDLDATNAFFAMSGVTQHGDTAVATYKATVDLAQAGQQWSYTGQFGLTSKNGQWVVDWAPSVINPRLGAGDRLAVVTTYAPRAGVLDMDGQPLLAKSRGLPDRRVPGQAEGPGRDGGEVRRGHRARRAAGARPDSVRAAKRLPLAAHA